MDQGPEMSLPVPEDPTEASNSYLNNFRLRVATSLGTQISAALTGALIVEEKPLLSALAYGATQVLNYFQSVLNYRHGRNDVLKTLKK